MKKLGKSGIRGRMVLIYFLLVFIAMVIASVYLLNKIESYQYSSLQQNIDSTVQESGLLDSLGTYHNLKDYQGELQEYIHSGFFYTTEEISVVDDNLEIIASTNNNLEGRNAGTVFDGGLITTVLETKTSQRVNSETAEGVSIMNLCYAIVPEGSSSATGVVYIRADLTSITDLNRENSSLFVRGTFIALIITILLAYILATSITEPINKVTETAEKMSKGDFSTQVPVRSNDEIGSLASMFNMMQSKLNMTLDEMQEEKSKLETILKNMADGLIAVSQDREIIHINKAARVMLSLPEEPVEGESLRYDSLLGKIDPRFSFSKLWGSIESEEAFNFDYNGKTFEVRCEKIWGEDDAATGLIILLQDITQRQKLEDMQKDFVANVSHELKTPLATVKAYTETLMDGGVDPETTDHFLEIVNSEADRMTRLVKDLLQLSRLDHRQERWNMKEEDMTKFMKLCVEKMQPLAKEKKQTIESSINMDVELKVAMDHDRMEQVISNVISNAVKYTGEGGHILVSTYKNGSYANVVVEDNGMGIAPENIDRIFERFYRVDKARSRAMGSSGLGLAISKQIVEEHHGRILVESTLGEGTKMTIMLPLVTHRGFANIE